MTQVDAIQGSTWHGRRGDLANAFRYSVDYVMLDADAQVSAPWLFSRNGRGIFSLNDRDHGGVPNHGTGAKWVRQVLDQHGIRLDVKIKLLAQPRILGHVFNPVSFWLCYDGQDNLCVVIAEVTNTFGDRHSYLCRNADLSPIKPSQRLMADKIFHVSPFQPIDGCYEFRFDIRPDKIGVWITLQLPNGGVMTNLVGPRRQLRTRDILWSCLRRPFGSRRVLGLIHWQALKLWIKGAKYRQRTDPPANEVS